MSVKATSAVIEERGLSPSERLVLIVLADQGDDAGYSWLGLETIADKVEIARRSVRRILVRLIASARLDRVHPGGGRGRPALYRVLPLVLSETDDSSSRARYERRFVIRQKGDNLSSIGEIQRGTPRSEKGDATARKGGPPGPPTHSDPLGPSEASSDEVVPDLPPRLPGETTSDFVVRLSEIYAAETTDNPEVVSDAP